MLYNASGKRMLTPDHRESFEGWKPQLDARRRRVTEIHITTPSGMSYIAKWTALQLALCTPAGFPAKSGLLRMTRITTVSAMVRNLGSGILRDGFMDCSCSMS